MQNRDDPILNPRLSLNQISFLGLELRSSLNFIIQPKNNSFAQVQKHLALRA